MTLTRCVSCCNAVAGVHAQGLCYNDACTAAVVTPQEWGLPIPSLCHGCPTVFLCVGLLEGSFSAGSAILRLLNGSTWTVSGSSQCFHAIAHTFKNTSRGGLLTDVPVLFSPHFKETPDDSRIQTWNPPWVRVALFSFPATRRAGILMKAVGAAHLEGTVFTSMRTLMAVERSHRDRKWEHQADAG